MNYTRLKVVCDPDFAEILMAEIAEAGFDTFMETGQGFEAYTEENKVDNAQLEAIKEKYRKVQPLIFFQDKIKKRNWNEEWEKNVDPVIVADQCLIRAEFHKIKRKYPYEIIITPKMSFGTGHHQTTHLMVQAQLQIDHKGKIVMDAGCGTAILSILAAKRGAIKVEAFDIDAWSIENGRENAKKNGCGNINISQGMVKDFSWPDPFDIVLANINKNVLLTEIEIYVKHLRTGGELLLSGFYKEDDKDLVAAADKQGLKLSDQQSRERWSSLLFTKLT